MAMDHNEKEAYFLMHQALGRALTEIHNPGASRSVGFDIVGHIEQVRGLAKRIAPNLEIYGQQHQLTDNG
jgi:hypothetical protein